jgi:hypothetical protein
MLNPPGIGVISSIEYSKTNLEKNFRNGVGNNTWCDAAIPRENLGYDIDRSLRDAVLGFKADSNVGLIVTVGGMAPAIAAKKYAEKRFVSLIGGTITPGFPGTITGYFCGGSI